ncbi:MAG: TonB-dependent receptor [Flavobacteriales bacterium]
MANLSILSPTKKALQINLDPEIYGTFAEIGAGQEVVRHFFRAGAASGTIAKAMSAYDKDFSDAIYGKEESGRYVCESRLKKMISHEYGLISTRLELEKHPNKRFFAFANNIATINYSKTIKGHGWMGLRFQIKPNMPPNDIIIHFNLHELEAKLQQETVGILGLNLIYACMYLYNKPKALISSLYDNLHRDRVEMNMIQMNGPDFEHVDNRLLSLFLLKNGMTDAVIFGPDGNNLPPSDVLYKKNILTIRGSFRPVTKVNIDMITTGYKQFVNDPKVDSDELVVLFEITLNNLRAEGDIDEQDFLDRADILCSLGQTVIVSNYQRYYKLLDYFSGFSKKRMGIILGVPNLKELFDERYYRSLSGGILEAFGKMFNRDLKVYLYPYKNQKTGELQTTENLEIHPRFRALYNYFVYNKRIQNIENFDPEVLHIFSRDVLRKIRLNEPGWEDMIPQFVDNIIKEKCLFGYVCKHPLDDLIKPSAH